MSFDTILAKKVHEQQVHIFVFQCDFCETKFTSDDNLKKHITKCSDKQKVQAERLRKRGKFEVVK